MLEFCISPVVKTNITPIVHIFSWCIFPPIPVNSCILSTVDQHNVHNTNTCLQMVVSIHVKRSVSKRACYENKRSMKHTWVESRHIQGLFTGPTWGCRFLFLSLPIDRAVTSAQAIGQNQLSYHAWATVCLSNNICKHRSTTWRYSLALCEICTLVIAHGSESVVVS